VGQQWDNTDYRFTEADAGKEIVFVCEVALHCQNGQIAKFMVAELDVDDKDTKDVSASSDDGGNGGGGGDGSGAGDGSGGGNGSASGYGAGGGGGGNESAGVAHFSNDVRRIAFASIAMMVSMSCVTLW